MGVRYLLPTIAAIKVFNSPTQHATSRKNQSTRQARIRATRGKKTQPIEGVNKIGLAREKAVTEVQVEGKLGGKRRGVAHPELPSKHRRVSEDEVVSYFSMVETGAQLHQSP